MDPTKINVTQRGLLGSIAASTSGVPLSCIAPADRPEVYRMRLYGLVTETLGVWHVTPTGRRALEAKP